MTNRLPSSLLVERPYPMVRHPTMSPAQQESVPSQRVQHGALLGYACKARRQALTALRLNCGHALPW